MEDLVTVRDVVNVLQRTEMVRRVAEELELGIIELGTEGRLVRLQLDELMGGVEEDRRLVIKDYFHEDSDWHVDEALEALADLSTEDLLDLKAVGAALHLPDKQLDLDESLQPRGFRLLSKIPRLPEPIIERIVTRFGNLQKIMRATIDDLDDVERCRRDEGPGDQGGPQPPRRVQHPRPVQLTAVTRLRTLPSRHRRRGSDYVRPDSSARPADGPRWSSIPDIMGLRALFDEHAQRLADDNGWAVAAVEPWPGREDMPLEERLGAVATIDDRALLADLVAAADLLERGAGRRDRVLHGRDVHVQGGGHRAVPPGRRLLRDAHGARALEGRRHASSRSTPSPPRARAPRWRSSARVDQWTPPADVEAAEAAGVTVVRYEGADHGFVHDDTRPAHRADDAADAWRGRSPSSASSYLARLRELFAVEDRVAALGLVDPAEAHEAGDGLVHPLAGRARPCRPAPPG